MIKKITLTVLLAVFFSYAFAVKTQKSAIDYLTKNQKELNISQQDIQDLIVLTDYLDDFSKINRVWFQQTAYGIQLKSGMVSVHFKDGKVVNYNNSGVFDLKKQAPAPVSTLSAKDAVAQAASYVGINGIGAIELQEKVKNSNLYIFKPVEGLSSIEIHAELLYVRDKQDKLHLGWEVQFHTLDDKHFWNIDVDAKDGSFINKYDQILHCYFGEGKYLASQETSKEHSYILLDNPPLPDGATNSTEETNATASYRVYPFTVESPNFGTRQLLTDPADVTASPYGWHDTNGVAGAEYTITRGNNVHAYADKDGNNKPDTGPMAEPDGGASLNFDFNLDFSKRLDTLVNSKAVITQLFYMNNIMHDIFYKLGFTEANRNFQMKNYTGVTGGNDYVWAEAHDGTKDSDGNVSKNNANFATSPDGVNSLFNRTRMQMYMWDGTPASTLTYNTPGSIAGEIKHGSQNGWGPCSYNVTGAVANAVSNTTPASYVCGAVSNASDITGKIALIDRGNCDFSQKVYYAQQAGAIGVIVINRQSAGDSLLGMAGGAFASSVTIPALIVTYADGKKLRDNLATATVTMYRQSNNNCLDFDGSLDNAIVAHEYGHGISTRLTGLSTGSGGTSACLSNAEQAGEGWSDFFALALTKKTTDNKNTPRGMGSYVWGEDANGKGIRSYPYSYDMNINPLTYTKLAELEDEHDVGEVWTAVLWDMYWNLVDKYGYSTDLYNGTSGNNRAMKLVVEGLKLQPCSPGFIDSRNAILKADSILYGYADKCEIWSAFARRGMGASAKQGSSNSTTDQTPAFDLPAACNNSPTATASFTVSDTTVCVGGSLLFTNTSTASAGSPDSVRWTIPGGTPSTSTSMTTVAPTFNTAGTYTISLVAYKSGNASTAYTKTIRVKAKPTVSVNSPTICAGENTTLTASGATSYTWSTGATSASIVVNPTNTTTYTVTGTTNGCSNDATATVTVKAKPTVSVNSPTICSGENTTLTASGATSYTWSTGATGASIVVNPTNTTTYTVTGTTNGCSNDAIATVTVKAKPIVTVTSPTICAGSTATLQANGANSYTWTGGLPSVSNPTTPILNSTTTYTVTGTTDGCSNSAVSTVTVTTAAPTVTISSNPSGGSVCAGATITLTGNGADNYTWTSSQTGTTTGNTLSFIPNGNLTVNLSGTMNGCSTQGTTSINITVKAKPTVSVNSPTICAGENTTLTASGATSYTWSTGATSASIVVNPTNPTTYTVTGTTNGCSNDATATVTVKAKPTVSVNSPTICAGENTTLTASGATSYTWSTGATGASIVVNPTNTTTYTVTGTTNGCSNDATATVTTKVKPIVTVTSPTICAGSTATLQANGANSYTWTGGLPSVSNPTTPTLNSTTTYTVTGTTDGCSNSAVSTVTVTTAAPTVTISSNPSGGSVCAGATITLTGNGADNYTWTSSQTGTTTGNTLSFIPNGNLTVNLSGTMNGCTTQGTTSINITVKAKPTVSVNSPTICSGENTTLTASGATSYTWSTGATSASIVVNPTNTTTYTVTGTTNGCSNDATATVTTKAKPTVSVNSPTICSGENTTLTASGATSYTWSTGATGASIIVNPTNTTTYTVTGTTNGCSNDATATVIVKAVPVLPIITQSGDTLYSSTINAGATYEWYKNESLISASNAPYIKITSGGSYTVKVIDGNCFSISEAFTAIYTGIKNAANSIQLLEVYPNPTDGRMIINLNLTKSAAVQIYIYSTDGRVLYNHAYSNVSNVNEELNLHDLSQGLYILRLQVNDEIYYHKIVKH